ncbi:hypothetical protein J7E52_25790 [Bacillus sp. ISL-34]|uniref:hypothetical protein n=1 Tax=Bacillus sp. ISL-34 TaxID=2819121 RepID=UPI001BE7973C|nr:hypothetical protein [Bacillus sp. ISL-34]MBT2650066.1 hypothetical protein [Bacillus sp. ISL-34]
MFKKIIILFGFLFACIGLSSFQITSAEGQVDEEVIILPGNDTLVEEDIKTAKKQTEKVMQDVAAHPELFQYATEITNETRAAMPYNFNFDFK